MTLTFRELWTGLHGMVLGAGFLLAFSGCAVGVWAMRGEWMTAAGREVGGRCLAVGLWGMTGLVWGAVLVGTFVIYPWYRAAPPSGVSSSGLVGYPKALLISRAETAGWHEFGMEWKEHVGWLAPILVTGVAVVGSGYRKRLGSEKYIRRTMLVLLSAAFFCGGVAGLLGALINKMAPVR